MSGDYTKNTQGLRCYAAGLGSSTVLVLGTCA